MQMDAQEQYRHKALRNPQVWPLRNPCSPGTLRGQGMGYGRVTQALSPFLPPFPRFFCTLYPCKELHRYPMSHRCHNYDYDSLGMAIKKINTHSRSLPCHQQRWVTSVGKPWGSGLMRSQG